MVEPKITDPLLNSRMRRHLNRLLISSVDAYRRWCKDRGFRPNLNKNLKELEAEIRAKRRTEGVEKAEASFASHLGELGIGDTEAYRRWCQSNRLSESLYKSPELRRKEIELKRSNEFAAHQPTFVNLKHDLAGIVRRIIGGDRDAELITHPALSRIQALSTDVRPSVSSAFIELCRDVIPRAGFLDVNPVMERFGTASGNSLVDALFAVSAHINDWIRAPEEWHPRANNRAKRFGELLRHLFCLYEIPEFMDSVWFEGQSEAAAEHQRWFVHLGAGENIRTAGVPTLLTKRMAHHFLDAVDNSTVVEAIRFGQIVALGGSEELARHVCATHLGEELLNEEFWITVLHFFVNNPMLDPSSVGPIVDYVNHRKFVVVENRLDDGTIEVDNPPDPDFSMKGRRVEPLLAAVDAWHGDLAVEQRRSRSGSWAPSGIPSFETTERDPVTDHSFRWTIEEIVTRNELFEEGKAMKHCVRSYLPSCTRGTKSIWSLRREDLTTGSNRRVLTIAVKNDTKHVVQARGKCNAMPGHRTNSRQADQVLGRDREVLAEGRSIMTRWGSENEIVVPRYT